MVLILYKNVGLEITDKEEINEGVRNPDSSSDEESYKEEDARCRKTLLDEGSHFLPVLSETLTSPSPLISSFSSHFQAQRLREA